MMMTTVDWIIIAIITLSTVMSLWRGATREIFSLITWVAAAYIGVKCAGFASGLFVNLIDSQSIRYAAAFIVIFIVVLIIGTLISTLLVRFINVAGLTVFDRILGILFGAARGVLIVAIGVILMNYTNIPKDEWWKSSQLLPQFEGVATSLTNWIEAQGLKMPAHTEKPVQEASSEFVAPINEARH